MVKEIEQWLADGQRSYAVGVDLLSRHGGTAQQVRVYANRSPRFAMAELMGELRRLSARSGGMAVKTVKSAVAERAKSELHELWVELSRIHTALFKTGEENTPAAMAARLALMERRDPMVERFSALYEAKEKFFAGGMSENELLAVVDGKAERAEEDEAAGSSLHAVGSLSDLELVKRMKAAKQGKIRAQNWLLYQQPTAAKAENPMPECPKRREWENRLEVYTREYSLLLAEKERRGI